MFLIQSEPETPYFARPVPNGISTGIGTVDIVVIKSITSWNGGDWHRLSIYGQNRTLSISIGIRLVRASSLQSN